MSNNTQSPKTFSELIKSAKPTLVDFSAAWCGPCKMMEPVLQELKKKVGDAVTVIKIDVDQSPQASAAYQISGVPTLILFQNGEIKWRQSGVVPAAYLEQIIQSHTKTITT